MPMPVSEIEIVKGALRAGEEGERGFCAGEMGNVVAYYIRPKPGRCLM